MGGDIETAAKLEGLGEMGQVYVQHQEVWDALVTFGLEVVLCHPHGVVTQAVHGLGDSLGLVESGGQVFVGKGAVINRGAAVSDVIHVHVARIQTVKLGYHVAPPFYGFRGDDSWGNGC